MIYHVRFADIAEVLSAVGFEEVGRTEATIIYRREDRRFIIHAPNVNGHLPEILMLDAFDAAGLSPPALLRTF